MTTAQNIIHWLVTSAVWFAVGMLLIREAKKKYGFDVFARGRKVGVPGIVGAIVCVAVMAFSQYLDWGGFKPALEFERLGAVKFIFQYVYYFLVDCKLKLDS